MTNLWKISMEQQARLYRHSVTVNDNCTSKVVILTLAVLQQPATSRSFALLRMTAFLITILETGLETGHQSRKTAH
jgi:hypothetical protein